MKNTHCDNCIKKTSFQYGIKCSENLRHFIHNNNSGNCESFKKKANFFEKLINYIYR